MTPGTYLRLRREAAGLDHSDVAALLLDDRRFDAAIARCLIRIERNDVLPSPSDADILARAFRFDRYVLRLLVCGTSPAPEICVGCGCSAFDACLDEQDRGCGWTDATHTRCTACPSLAIGHAA